MTTTTAIITNYKTHNLVKACFESIRKYYPELPVIVLDNGSDDESTKYITNLKDDHTNVILLYTNIGHGLAMDQTIRGLDSEWVWTIDSDTEILKSNLLEDMLAEVDNATYAIGWRRYVDKISGVPADWFVGAKDCEQFIIYIHPCCALYRRSMYLSIRPFIHHGAPCLHNMQDANSLNLGLIGFPVFDYVKHWAGGTRRMFSSNKGDWNPGPGDKPRPWDSKQNVPI